MTLVVGDVTANIEEGSIGDGELEEILARIAQVPAGNTNLRGGSIEQFDRVALGRIGVTEHFIDNDIVSRFHAGSCRGTVEFDTGPPGVGVVVSGIGEAALAGDFERTAVSVGTPGP